MSRDETLLRKPPCQFNILNVNTTKAGFINMALKNTKHVWKGREVSLFKGFKGSRWNCKPPPHTIAQICTTFLLMLFLVCKYSKPESKWFSLNPDSVERAGEKFDAYSLLYVVCGVTFDITVTSQNDKILLYFVQIYIFQNHSDFGIFCCLYSHS